MTADHDKCANCGAGMPLSQLDAKPSHLAGPECTAEDLDVAADVGFDFNRLECRKCYGPGWREE